MAAIPALHVTITTAAPPAAPPAALCLGRFDTPFGRVIALEAGGALHALGLAGEIPEDEVLSDLSARWPAAQIVEAPEALAPAIDALLKARGELRVALAGTDFQMRVWRVLLNVPPGQVISYGQIAHAIGQPGASRAVGTAVGQNPVAWAVPCHRVTRGSGEIGGYHWGVSIKRALLAAENMTSFAGR